MTRLVTVACMGAKSARLLNPPADSDVSNVTTDFYGVHFDVHPHDGAPRFEDATFEVTGAETSIEKRVTIEVVPLSENSPPICDSDHITQRSDGTGPVDVYLHPYCRDPDGDDFVIEGGPPGVHLDSPKHVHAGDSDSNWNYRTATFSGDESTTIWATDSLGARSADTRLDVTVGPAVDRPPECRTNPSYGPGDVAPIWSRPGATRRFALVCTDPDADAFTTAVSSPPRRGVMAAFDVGDPVLGFWGAERWVDATYVPADESLEPDPFSVTATGPSGDETVAHMAITPRQLPENGGGGCSWSGVVVPPDTPGTISFRCDDDEGDPLYAEMDSRTLHGTVEPAVVTPAPFGQDQFTIPYVPDPGHLGYDCLKVKVTDRHGLSFELTVDINVAVAPPPFTGWTNPLPTPPIQNVPPLPAEPSAAEVRAVVERTLGTRAVKRVRTMKNAQVWARSQVSRRDLMRYGRAPGVMVVCFRRCRVTGASVLAAGVPARAIGARGKTAEAATAGQSRVLSLAIGRTERRALRRARRPRAKFSLRVSSGAQATTLARSIPLAH